MGDVSGLLRQQVLEWLAVHVPEARLSHILRVEQMAIELAQIHALNVDRAAQAGLMHDLAKYFKPDRLLEMAQREQITLDPILESNPHLLHADASAVVAREQFAVSDPEVLAAIANHTLGKPAMGKLSCIVFLADSLEPGRGDTAELDELRQISRQNLDQAVWMTCEYTMQYLMEARRLIHPRVLQTRNWFLNQHRQRPHRLVV